MNHCPLRLLSLDDFPKVETPVVLTLGLFDGVHIGHQALIKSLIYTAQEIHGTSVLITFQNSPKELLYPEHHFEAIQPFEQRLETLSSFDIDIIVALAFTKKFSTTTPEVFLKTLHDKTHFTHLVLGYDTQIGFNKAANVDSIIEITKPWNTDVQIASVAKIAGQPISSSVIRSALLTGDLDDIENLLGRRYSILAPIINRTKIALILSLNGLTTLPEGEYPVQVNGQYTTATIDPSRKTLQLSPIPKVTTPNVEVIF